MKLEVLARGDAVAWIRLEERLDLRGVEEVELLYTVKAARAESPSSSTSAR